MRLQDYLESKQVPFEVLGHRATYDSQRMAQALHVSGHDVAKTVFLRLGDKPTYAVAVLPATRSIDLVKAGRALGADHAVLASEYEMFDHLPECEVGALPPFGSCYNMPTVADRSLADSEEIFFQGDSHEESIRMKYSDFSKLEHPTIAAITA